MIAANHGRYERNVTWQDAFLELLPEIQRRLSLAFCRLNEEAREESIAEGTIHCLLAFIRLFERGGAESATASTLAWYASRQVKLGRPAAGRMNGNEPLSRYARNRNCIQAKRLPLWSAANDGWIDMIVDDKWSSVADQVAARLDIKDWLATLSRRMKRIAKDLAQGFTTGEVAQKYGVTAGRISQIRRRLQESWAAFQQEYDPSGATVRPQRAAIVTTRLVNKPLSDTIVHGR